MKTSKFDFLKKKEFLIIIIGIIISLVIASHNISNFDRNIKNSHNNQENILFKSDLSHSWEMADEFRSRLKNNENFFESFPVYNRTLLQPILVGYYYYILDKEIYEKNKDGEKIIKINNFKIGILYIQIIIFYLSVFFLTKSLIKKLNNRYIFLIILFLCLEPTILQWHSSFWTESLFLSMTIFLLCLMINLPKKVFYHFPIGILLGLMYLHKAVSIFLIIPIVIYYFLVFKKNLVPTTILLFGYLSIILVIGINHYKKTNTFFITSPMHAYYSYYHYFAHKIYADRMGISVKEAKNKLIENENKWKKKENIIIENDILKSDTKQLIKNISYRNEIFLKEIIANPIFSLKFFTKKIIVMSVLDPSWVSQSFYLDKSSKEAKINPKEYFHKNLKRNILYSFILYFFVLAGVIFFIKEIYIKRKMNLIDKFLLLNILLIAYYLAVAGPWGNPRYFAPCLINLSIFFSYGFNNLKDLIHSLKA